MAKYEFTLKGDFYSFLNGLHRAIMEGSISASHEDSSDYICGNVRCAVRVYERYSYFGGNRVSMNVTLLGSGEDLFLSVITSGGSQAVFFKLNTVGEKSFLSCVQEFTEKYQQNNVSW